MRPFSLLVINVLLVPLGFIATPCECSWADSGTFPPEGRSADYEINRCGRNALQACAQFVGIKFSHEQIDDHLPTNGDLVSFSQLANASSQLGLRSYAVRWKSVPFGLNSAPAILAIVRNGQEHYISALGRAGDSVYVLDFPFAGWISHRQLRDYFAWKGDALHISSNRAGLLIAYAATHLGLIGLCLTASAGGVILLQRLKIRSRTRPEQVGTVNSSSMFIAVVILIITSILVIGCGPDNHFTAKSIAITLLPKEKIIDASIISAQGDDNDPRLRKTAITVRNDGSETVTIRKVNLSCGCTQASPPTLRTLAEGDTATVPLTVQLPEYGEQSVSVAVLIDADSGKTSSTATTKILLRGKRLEPPALLEIPRDLSLRVDSAKHAKATVVLRTLEEESSPPWLESIISDAADLHITLEGLKESKSSQLGLCVRSYSYVIEATVKPSSVQRRESADNWNRAKRLEVRGKNLDRSVAQFYVRFDDDVAFRLIPEAIFISRSQQGAASFDRFLRVAFDNATRKPLRIDAESDCDWLIVEPTPKNHNEDGDGEEYIIRVVLDKASDIALTRGNVIVRVHQDNGEVVERHVPVVLSAAMQVAG